MAFGLIGDKGAAFGSGSAAPPSLPFPRRELLRPPLPLPRPPPSLPGVSSSDSCGIEDFASARDGAEPSGRSRGRSSSPLLPPPLPPPLPRPLPLRLSPSSPPRGLSASTRLSVPAPPAPAPVSARLPPLLAPRWEAPLRPPALRSWHQISHRGSCHRGSRSRSCHRGSRQGRQSCHCPPFHQSHLRLCHPAYFLLCLCATFSFVPFSLPTTLSSRVK